MSRSTDSRLRLAGDLLEVEGWYYINGFEVGVDFDVTWRHPKEGIGGVYRAGGSGFRDFSAFGLAHLEALAEDAVFDAKRDFEHHGAYFARDLRIRPVRDTTDAATYLALRRGPPYPERSGRVP